MTSLLSKNQLIAQIDKALDVPPGLETSFSQPIRDHLLESVSHVDGQIVVKIKGDDLSEIGWFAVGQAVLNGVVILTHYNELRSEGVEPVEAVRQESLTRLLTVLMTAWLAMLGLLPMALSHAIGAETQGPLAVVGIGGLVSATVLTLRVHPTFYISFARRGGVMHENV